MRMFRSNLARRMLVVMGITLCVLVLGAILLPPKGSSAMPRDGSGNTPALAPR